LGAKALELAKDFNGDMKVDSAAALVFNAWADQLTRNLFSRLGYIFSETYGDRNYRGALLAQIRNPNSPWCDNPKTALVETCLDASNDAFDKALQYLSKEYGDDPKKWSWGNAHIAISEHRPMSKVPLLRKLFNLEAPFPGDSNTVNVGRLELLRTSNPYETKQAPSLRTIYDLSDLENSLFIYQTGQSGWVQSKLYRNMNPLWAKNEYLPLQMKPENSKRQLELVSK
jgi:penicillin amidase